MGADRPVYEKVKAGPCLKGIAADVKTIATGGHATEPIEGQQAGTSGLRKPTSLVEGSKFYIDNFIQSIFNAQDLNDYKGRSLVISGDGRYLNRTAIQTALEICAGNGVQRVYVGQCGWLSTPAVSAMIRARKAAGGIIFTASHNPGGPKGDFGIKYNIGTGAPAPEEMTSRIHAESLKIKWISGAALPIVDLDTVGRHVYDLDDGNCFIVEIVDPTSDWLNLMEQIFDFDSIRKLIARSDFSFCYDGLSGIAGPYAKALFVKTLGACPSQLQNCDPLEDFGGHHPDPNLTYAKSLVERMKVFEPSKSAEAPEFGAAGDGDNDRNMILGRSFFVTPSDSVAIIAHYASQCIPYYQKYPLKGVARSMPTSRALDFVAKKLNISAYEVPTGWKFFGNLMDDDRVSLCGEESFGTGSDHIREKDGLWAVLCWMSILAYRNGDTSKPFVGVEEINREFWKTYGRVFYTRYDYEEVTVESVTKIKQNMENVKDDRVEKVSSFTYVDPVDKSVTKNQGIIIEFKDGSRIIGRSSGTGSKGATLRVYMEMVEKDENKMFIDTKSKMESIVQVMKQITQVNQETGRSEPTVIT